MDNQDTYEYQVHRVFKGGFTTIPMVFTKKGAAKRYADVAAKCNDKISYGYILVTVKNGRVTKAKAYNPNHK